MSASVPREKRSPIVQYWHSPAPPDRTAESVRSFARLNPERPHLLFNARTADDFIAEHLTERESRAFRSCGPPAMQADYLRYCAIWQLGGIWADTGYRCLRNLGVLLDGSEGGELFRWPSPYGDQLLMNGLFAFPERRHPFLRMTIEVSTQLIEERWRGRVTEVTGPLILTMTYGLYRAGSVDALQEELRRSARGSDQPPPDPVIQHYLDYAETVCDLAGGYERVAAACEGIRVYDSDSLDTWVDSPYGAPPHRDTSNHWSHLGSDIYVDCA